MNLNTGHLVDLDSDEFRPIADKLKEEGYEEVPQELWRAAKTKLRGAAEANVSLNSGGKLSQWAAKKRKNRRRNHIAKESRKRNR